MESLFESLDCHFDERSFKTKISKPYIKMLNGEQVSHSIQHVAIASPRQQSQPRRRQLKYNLRVGNTRSKYSYRHCEKYNVTFILKRVIGRTFEIANIHNEITTSNLSVAIFDSNNDNRQDFSVKIKKIDISIFNGGLHYLHWFEKEKHIAADMATPIALLNNNYEKHYKIMLNETYKLHGKCSIFVSTNPICDSSNFRGRYLNYSDIYLPYDNLHNFYTLKQSNNKFYQLLVNCSNTYNQYYQKQLNQLRGMNIDVDPKKIRITPFMCYQYSFTNHGVRSLNDRLRLLVKNIQNKTKNDHVKFNHDHDHINVELYLFDSYLLFADRCRWSPIGDGRHYQKIKWIQELALFQLLDKIEC